jgi:hypothetical protein
MDIQTFFKSKQFKLVLLALGGLIILLMVFQLGMFVGFRKADFAFRWGDNYYRAFGGPQGGFLRDFEGRDFTGGHGVAGSIIKIDGSSIIVKGSDNIEKVIVVDGATVISKGRQVIQLSDLKIDDRIVVIGSPKDDGSVAAKVLRVFGPADVIPPSPSLPILPKP